MQNFHFPSENSIVFSAFAWKRRFLRGDQYAIALGLLDEGKVVLGVLACPNLPFKSIARSDSSSSEDKAGFLFFAEVGGGTYMQSLDGSSPTKVSIPLSLHSENFILIHKFRIALRYMSLLLKTLKKHPSLNLMKLHILHTTYLA